MPLAYVVNPLDRRANERPDPEWLAALRQRPDAKLIRIAGDSTLIEAGQLATKPEAFPELTVLLGLDEAGTPWFACKTEQTEAFRDLRSLAMEEALPPEQLGILAQARSVIQWHERRNFCSNCATKLEIADAGYRRHCPGCGMDHFPRTDPVVIMLATFEGKCLMGRQAIWPKGMYSALAGFLEPGETMEEACARELFEEAALTATKVHYHSTQPWPYPNSLMIGLIAEVDSADARPDQTELEAVRWFTRDEARQLINGGYDGCFAPPPLAIAHQLVKSWAEGEG